MIVLDLSQEHISKNATFAEILHASGIISDNATITTAASLVSSSSSSSTLNKPILPDISGLTGNPNVIPIVSSKTTVSDKTTSSTAITTTAATTTSINLARVSFMDSIAKTTTPSIFNTNNVITASTNTVTSVQASSENRGMYLVFILAQFKFSY